MTRNVKYTQCAMRRIVAGASSASRLRTSRTQFAKVGRVLKLRDRRRTVGSMAGWSNTVGDVIVEGEPTSGLRARRSENHRKSTGDSTPRLNA